MDYRCSKTEDKWLLCPLFTVITEEWEYSVTYVKERSRFIGDHRLQRLGSSWNPVVLRVFPLLTCFVVWDDVLKGLHHPDPHPLWLPVESGQWEVAEDFEKEEREWGPRTGLSYSLGTAPLDHGCQSLWILQKQWLPTVANPWMPCSSFLVPLNLL